MNQDPEFPSRPTDLPPEVHLKMALDYLLSKARKLNLSMTATLIEAAALSTLQEMTEDQDEHNL